MGTYTDFTGAIRITPCLKEPLAGRFRQFLGIRHMKRDVKILDAFYQNDTVFEELPAPGFAIGDLWYRHVCDITLSKMSAGVLPYGAVSSSGFGDGGYTCYTHADENGVIDFAFIVFI